jgi:uncharacterized protein YndB with AHSA1/START domain
MIYNVSMDKTYSAETSIEINATPEKIWDVLVNPDLVKQYLHGTTMQADWREGGAITWSGEWKGQSYVDKGTVLVYDPYKAIKTTHWSPMSGTEDKPENYHHVAYELNEEDGKTTLTLTQGNSPTQQDADSMIENGWKPMMQEIKKLAESS